MNCLFRMLCFSLVTALALTAPVNAVDVYWTGGGAQYDFDDPDNWGAALTTADVAVVNSTTNGPATITATDIVTPLAGLYAGWFNNVAQDGAGALKMTGGTLDLNGALRVGYRSAGTATGISTFEMTGGTINFNNNGLRVGYQVGAVGQMSMSNAVIDNATAVYVGLYNTSTTGTFLELNSGASINPTFTGATTVYVGYGLGNGTLTLNNNTSMQVAGGLNVGWFGGTGVLNLNGGTIVQKGGTWASIGDNTSSGVAGNGTVNVNDGLLDLSQNTIGMTIGTWGATGTWNQNGGTTIISDANSVVRLGGPGANSKAYLNLNGGTFIARYLYSYNSDVVEGQINFNGGTLKASADNADWINLSAASDDKIQIRSLGATIDTDVFNVTINEPLLKDGGSPGGGLTKLGTGTLTLPGTANTYDGATNVNAGKLVIPASTTLATGSVSVGNGGTLVLEQAASLTNTLTDLSLDGGSTLSLGLSTSAADPANAIDTVDLNLPAGTRNFVAGAQGNSLQLGTYTVISQTSLTGTGTIAGSTNTRAYTVTGVAVNPTNVQVTIGSTGNSAANLEWSGVGNVWDTKTSSNWYNPLGSTTPDMFYELDTVNFTSTGYANSLIDLAGRVHPAAIVVNSYGYTLQGAGWIQGNETSLSMLNGSQFTVNTNINIGGPVTLAGGTLSLGTNSGRSAFSGPVTLSGYAVIDVQGEELTMSGVVGDSDGTGLYKTGGGVLKLTNTGCNYTGATTVTGGTLSTVYLSPASINIMDATLLYTNPADFDVLNGISPSGSVKIGTTGSTLTLHAESTYVGTTVLQTTGSGNVVITSDTEGTYPLGADVSANGQGATLTLQSTAATTYQLTEELGAGWGWYGGSQAVGTLKILGATTTVDVGMYLHIGRDYAGCDGTLILGTPDGTDGPTVNVASWAEFGQALSTSEVNLYADSQLNITNDLYATHCTINVNDDADLTIVTGSLEVGNDSTINVNDGASFTANNLLEIGRYGNTGELNVNDDATVDVAASLRVGVNWGADGNDLGVGTVNVDGANAQVTVTGAGTYDNGWAHTLVIGFGGGEGTWNQNGGTTTSVNTVIVGQYDYWDTVDITGGTGVLSFNGGEFRAPGFSTQSGPRDPAEAMGVTTGEINFNSGKVTATANNGDFFNNDDDGTYGTVLTLNVQEGGAVINTDAYHVAVVEPLVHDPDLGEDPDGGLIKQGSGILTLGDNLTYTGETDIQAGLLQLTYTGGTTNLLGGIASSTGAGNLAVTDGVSLSTPTIAVASLTIGGAPIPVPAPAAPVPEPSTWVLLFLAAMASALGMWRKRR